jgi:hypothetical protein
MLILSPSPLLFHAPAVPTWAHDLLQCCSSVCLVSTEVHSSVDECWRLLGCDRSVSRSTRCPIHRIGMLELKVTR